MENKPDENQEQQNDPNQNDSAGLSSAESFKVKDLTQDDLDKMANKKIELSVKDLVGMFPLMPTTTTQEVQMSFSGMLPPPTMMAQYPDEGKALTAMTEKEQQHRHESERMIADMDLVNLRNTYSLNTRGQWMGLTVVLAWLLAVTLISINGQPIAGGVLGIAGITGIVKVFTDSHKKSED